MKQHRKAIGIVMEGFASSDQFHLDIMRAYSLLADGLREPSIK